MDKEIAGFNFEELAEGQSFSFNVTVRREDIDSYAEISGDISPLHMDDGFARSRGFEARVAHGGLLASYISRMVGVYCPGENALLHTMNLKFLRPVYPGNSIRVNAVIEQVSAAAKAIVLKVWLDNEETGDVCVRGKVQVGFTENISP